MPHLPYAPRLVSPLQVCRLYLYMHHTACLSDMERWLIVDTLTLMLFAAANGRISPPKSMNFLPPVLSSFNISAAQHHQSNTSQQAMLLHSIH